MAIHLLSRVHPGWTLTEIRGLTLREKRNWLSIAMWEMGMSNA